MLAAITVQLCGCSASEAIQDGIDAIIYDIPEDDPVEVKTVSGDKIAYNQLSEEAKKVYDQMLDCIKKFKKKITLSSNSTKVMELAMEALRADNPEIYWMDGYTYNTYQRGEKVVGLTFEPKYTMSKKSRDDYQRRIDEVAGEWLGSLPQDADDYAKSRHVFETLINNVDYNVKAKNNQNLLSVFIGKETVCQGYAEATVYLLDKLGVSAMVVSGEAGGESHAWTYAVLDGEGYFIDTTWGNSRYRGEGDDSKHVNYAYLNVRTAEMEASHKTEMMINVPVCRSVKDNYYRREGLYFEAFAEDRIGAVIAEAYNTGARDVSVKLASDVAYEQMIDYFLKEGRIGDYCPGIDSVSYITSDDMRVITIEF